MANEATQGAIIEPRDNLSYVRSATDIPLSDTTVSRHLLDTVARFPDHLAVVFCEQNVR